MKNTYFLNSFFSNYNINSLPNNFHITLVFTIKKAIITVFFVFFGFKILFKNKNFIAYFMCFSIKFNNSSKLDLPSSMPQIKI